MSSPRLLKIVADHFAWQCRMLGFFLRHALRVTLQVTFLRMASQFAQVLAMFIPLKIILMLISDSIPRALRWLISVETRDIWLVGLTVTTILLYISTIFFDLLANRTVARGAAVLATVTTSGLQRKQLKRLFIASCRGYANLAVFFVGALAIMLLMPLLFTSAVVIMFGQLVLLSIVFRYEQGLIGWLHAAIKRKTKVFFKYLSAMNFMVVFLLLFLEYLIKGRVEPIAAILTLILARRIFQSLASFANSAVVLHDNFYKNQRLLLNRY